jgi:hypothetical protein
VGKLTMAKKPEKAAVNNSGEKTVGVSVFLDEITKAEPFLSLFQIQAEILEAIKADMAAHGFDESKPVNIWRTEDGRRVLIDGYTRVRAAEELGFLKVTASERTFNSEAEALAYAIHTQRDRRNLNDMELLHLVETVDERKEPGRKSGARAPNSGMGPREPIEGRSATITAAAIGTSPDKVKKARVVNADPEEREAVRRGEKSLNQAAKAARAKKSPAASEHLKAMIDPKSYILTDDEYEAVYEWIDREKDGLPYNLKEGLLKLVNGEEKRRMFGTGKGRF